MIVQNYTSKGGDIFRVFLNIALRYYDRGFSFDWKKKGENDDIPNTKRLR